MKRILFFIGVMIFCAPVHADPLAQGVRQGVGSSVDLQTYFGTWKVVRILGSTSITWSPAEGQKIVGTTFEWSEHKVTLMEGACEPEQTKISIVNIDHVLSNEFGVDRSWLDISPKLLGKNGPYVDALCWGAIVLKNGDIIIEPGTGYVYLARKIADPK